ncbi:hypothetical protein AVEN_61230-1 [Araneus ventricosus]|uniref:Uncharacterized protein n=1 Tax=Araneus ventricosus TaxID=182803 RepID=A0A4Y2JYD3_ARAVE|nr:hypothetical protein AVEN_61230-1 [Araneus ventricosus]
MTRTTPQLAPLSKIPRHSGGRAFGHYIRISVHRAPYTADLRWFRTCDPLVPRSRPYQEVTAASYYGVEFRKMKSWYFFVQPQLKITTCFFNSFVFRNAVLTNQSACLYQKNIKHLDTCIVVLFCRRSTRIEQKGNDFQEIRSR